MKSLGIIRALIVLISVVSSTIMMANMKQGMIKYDSRSNLPSELIVYDDIYSREELDNWSKDPQYDNQWRLVERLIPDNATFKQLKRDSIALYRRRLEEAEDRVRLNSEVSDLIGKSIQTELQKNYVSELLELIDQIDPKDAKAISKDLNKNKISKKIRKYLELVDKRTLQPSCSAARKDYDLIRNDWERFYLSKGRKCPELTFYTYVDTVENPHYGSIDAMKYADGWDWVDFSSLKEKHESFPISVYYNYDPNHPEYRLKNINNTSYVFDNDGHLIRVLSPNYVIWRQNFNVHDGDNPVFKLIARIAYQENEYGVQSEDSQTKHYIKTQLGLEERTAAEKREQEKRIQAIADAIVGSARDAAKYPQNSKKGRALQNKHAANFTMALIGGNNTYSSRGDSWLSQIEDDYWQFFKDNKPYKFERIDDTSIRVIYADDNSNPTFEVIYSYTSKEPYKVTENVTVNKLFTGPAKGYKTK